jgi:beta-N-acetylhexosaminidase
VAGLCLFSRSLASREQARDLIADARAAAGRRLLVTVDQEGGGVVRLVDGPVPPAAMALGAADDAALTERVAAATARSLRAVGIDVDLAPVADVALDPDNPVISDRAFGADPERVADHVAAFVRGLQGAGVAASLKHFPGHGDVSVDSHLALPTLDADLARLREVEWRPFRAGIAAGAASVMTAHLRVPSLDPARPATLSSRVLARLREELGFDGVVFTDALDMRAVADRWPPPVAAVEALAAGADAPLSVGRVEEHRAVLRAVEAAVRDGRLDPAALATSEARLARLAAAFPADPAPDARVEAADLELMAHAARRAVVALGTPPRLDPGAAVAVTGGGPVAAGAASDAREDPTGALVQALRAAGHPVVRVAPDGAGLGEALEGAALAIVTTSSRTEPPERELATARAAFAAARAAGVPAVHVPLWNPVHVRRLPGPALVPFGFRRDALRAVVAALESGDAPGRTPVPLILAPPA